MANTLFAYYPIFGGPIPSCSILGLVSKPAYAGSWADSQGRPLLPSGSPVNPLVEIRGLVEQGDVKQALMLLLDELEKRQ